MEKLVFVISYVNQFKISMDMQDDVTTEEATVLAHSLDQFLKYFTENYNQSCYTYDIVNVAPDCIPIHDLTTYKRAKRGANGKR